MTRRDDHPQRHRARATQAVAGGFLTRATQVVASGLLVLVAVTGCAATPTDLETDAGLETGVGPVTEAGAETDGERETDPEVSSGTDAVPSGLHRVTGHAVATDDTGLPDTPMTGATFVLLPAAVEDEVWAAAGIDPGEHQLPYLRAELDRSVIAEGLLVETSARGEFVVDAPAGDHLLCRVGDLVEADARWTSGCAELTVPGSGSWRVTAGEGGFHASDMPR